MYFEMLNIIYKVVEFKFNVFIFFQGRKAESFQSLKRECIWEVRVLSVPCVYSMVVWIYFVKVFPRLFISIKIVSFPKQVNITVFVIQFFTLCSKVETRLLANSKYIKNSTKMVFHLVLHLKCPPILWEF